ncbi:MAG TPA: hypothetical protein VEY06_00705, partial [Flavisolibacter sp.]|nr:hypothetical protein [Flavisolibacter sp.]
MSYVCKFAALLCILSLNSFSALSQTEFPKEFIAHLRLHSGMITGAGNTPDIFVGGLQVIPQFTLVEHKVRGGIVAGAAYSYKKLSGMFGPTVSLNIKEFKGGHFGSLGNLHINADHLWG